MTLDDIDWLIPHQASRRALELIVRRLGVPTEKVVDIVATHGNQVSASIPAAFHTLLNDRPIKQGDLVLFLGTSAGVGMGAMIWEKP